jgi:hypothetical protein
VIVYDTAMMHFCSIKSQLKKEKMKGKYITTSLLLAIMASEKAANTINVAETKASTEGHEFLWNKNIPAAKEIRARIKGRDELKFA